MNVALLQSPLLAPVRYVWRAVRRFKPVREFIERRVLYPDLPHITRANDYADGPTLLAGFFSANLGQGEAARLELVRMRQEGREVFGVDISPAFGLCDLPLPEGVIPREQASCTGPLILHCNAPETGRALQYLGKKLTTNRHITGYWAWELEVPPFDWERAYKYVDALWVLSKYSVKAFCDAPVPVTVRSLLVPILPDAGHSLADLGFSQGRDKIAFLCMADARSDLVRKNIVGTIQAFDKACTQDSRAVLLVKLHHTECGGAELQKVRELCAACEHVYLLENAYSTAERNSLLHRVDAVISLHRAEGYGLMLAEALALGKKIVATKYSGPLDFLDEHNSLLVDYSMIPVKADTPNYGHYTYAEWAEPDLETAAHAIAQVVSELSSDRGHE